jgi:serine protease Do
MAGIKEKDVIVRIGTFPVRNEEDVRDSMFHFSPGDKVDVEIVRNGKHSVLSVKLGDPAAYAKANSKKSPDQSPQDGGDQSIPFPNSREFGNQPNPFTGGPGPSDEKPLRTGKAKLGVTVEPMSASLRSQFNIPASVDGAVVTTVVPGSVAENVGLQPGSVITMIGTKAIHTAQDVFDAMSSVKWGDSVQFSYSSFANNTTMSRSQKVTF